MILDGFWEKEYAWSLSPHPGLFLGAPYHAYEWMYLFIWESMTYAW